MNSGQLTGQESLLGFKLAGTTKGLSFRIFLYFFVVNAAVLLATFYLTHETETHEQLLSREAPKIIQNMLDARSRGGNLALDQQHDNIRSELQINAYLCQNGIIFGTRPAPPSVKERIAELRSGQGASLRLSNGGRLLAIPVYLSPAEQAHAIFFAQQETNKAGSRQWLVFLQLSALLATAALVGWFVARALATPIKHLQNVVNRVASGDLNSRVGTHLNTSVAELSQLGHDIDHMAVQLKSMLNSRDRMFHHLSHEMRSPLARLRILLEMLRESDSDDKAQNLERLRKADYEIDRLDIMINEILGLAKLESGDPPPMEPVLMTEIIDECVEFSRVEAEAKSVRLDFNFVESDAKDVVTGNRELLLRTIDNLLRNAIRFTPANQTVSISLVTLGAHLILSVADQGPGVPDNYMDSIFEPYFRLSTPKPLGAVYEERGYGLGLTFVKLAAKMHAATVTARNNAEGGLVISIKFARYLESLNQINR